MRVVQTHPDWLLGFADEVWWSRVTQPDLHTWADADQPLHLVEQTVAKPRTGQPAPSRAPDNQPTPRRWPAMAC